MIKRYTKLSKGPPKVTTELSETDPLRVPKQARFGARNGSFAESETDPFRVLTTRTGPNGPDRPNWSERPEQLRTGPNDQTSPNDPDGRN